VRPVKPKGWVRERLACFPEYGHAVVASGPLGRKSAITLVVVGFLCVVLTFLAAFTIYGDLAAVVGLACIVGGALLLGRSGAQSG
jgi:hypothetical protein